MDSAEEPPFHAPEQQLHNILHEHSNFRQGQSYGQADLTGEDLRGMDFRGYRLDLAILKNTKLNGANFTDVRLTDADISGADLRDASITPLQARSTKGWLLARWSPVLLNALGLPPEHNERLEFKDFRKYALSGARLNDLDLTAADFRDATLDNVTFVGANLEFADFGDASLRNADLTNTHGLRARQLRGAVLILTQLPPEIAESLNTLPGVDEATKTSRKVFLTMLVACLYCWLTILSTTDAGLLIGSSTLALPIVQTPIPVVAFFGAAPVLLLIVYLYLHFSLQNLWDALATLPAVFPDGRPVHERALPWILSPIVRLYFKRLQPDSMRLPEFQVRATAVLVWWGVPFTLLAFWGRFLVRQNRLITTLHVIVAGVSVWLSVMLWKMTKDTLRGLGAARPRWYKALRSRAVLAGVLAGAFLALFSVGSFYGEAPFNAFSVGDLGGAALSQKPDKWDGKDLDAVKGPVFYKRAMGGIYANSAFGVRAVFVDSDLRRANFDGADLRGASFTGGDLEMADFEGADLRFARFVGVDIQGALFTVANIQGAVFFDSDRRFRGRRAYVVQEDPKGLRADQISPAENWYLAHLSSRMLVDLKVCESNKPCDHEDRLSRRDFSGLDLTRFVRFSRPDFSRANLQHSSLRRLDLRYADFSNADLRHTDLYETRLDSVNLTGADLRGADLKTVLGLTRGQIESALTDDETQLPPYLEAQKPFTPKK